MNEKKIMEGETDFSMEFEREIAERLRERYGNDISVYFGDDGAVHCNIHNKLEIFDVKLVRRQ